MATKQSDKLQVSTIVFTLLKLLTEYVFVRQEIKERVFNRLNIERQNLIRKRRQQSGFGTYTPEVKSSNRKGIFDTPANKEGIVSKCTKLVAQEVDLELLNDNQLWSQMMEEEREQCLPDLTVDEWNEIYLEVTRDLNRLLAKQLIEDRKSDVESDFELNEMFSQLAIDVQAETLDPTNNDSCVCALCKRNVARRIKGSRIVCELPGCLDIDIYFTHLRVEDVMIKVCRMLDEHKRHAQDNNSK